MSQKDECRYNLHKVKFYVGKQKLEYAGDKWKIKWVSKQ